MTFWNAPSLTHPRQIPAHATLEIPTSKSLTNRYLILAALSETPTKIIAPLVARDTNLMRTALTKLGTKITDLPAENAWLITPQPLHGAKISAGLAGTVLRFIPVVAALADGETIIDGDLQAYRRPMQTTISSLRDLGGEISGSGAEKNTLPLRILGKKQLLGGTVKIDASSSSQFISALLLAAPRFQNGLHLYHIGTKLPSLPHIEMTLAVLRQAGVAVSTDPQNPAPNWAVAPSKIHLGQVRIETDLSNAGPFLAAAMLSAGQVKIKNWPAQTTQAGAHFLDLFTRMGATVQHFTDNTLMLTGPAQIAPLNFDCHAIGELVPTLAAVAAFATGTSVLRNIGQLRGHETDRLAALETELRKVGVGAEVKGDDLVICPPLHSAALLSAALPNSQTLAPHTPRATLPRSSSAAGGYCSAQINSYHDHRMATFGAILGLRIPGVQVENIATTAKTLPNFVQLWESLIHQSHAAATAPIKTTTPSAPTATSAKPAPLTTAPASQPKPPSAAASTAPENSKPRAEGEIAPS